MGRRLIIGDMHARYDVMRKTLDKAGFDPQDDVLYSVGDFCDRGDKPVQTLEYLMDLGDSFRPVLGNHDAWLESALMTGIADPNWTDNNGGEITEKEVFSMPENWREKLKIWLASIPVIRMLDNAIIVHGGVPGGVGDDLLQKIAGIPRPVPLFRMFWKRESEDEIALMNYLELFYWDRDYLMSAIAHEYGGIVLRQPLDTDRTLWIGHTPLAKGKPYISEAYHLRAIDTGAGSGRGPITVMDMDTKEYWQAMN